ncbi:MAG: hypothetical protein PSN04_10640 [Methyloprofundus sp.]|nr:hypothetical protein [Methyloprofundus sp.]
MNKIKSIILVAFMSTTFSAFAAEGFQLITETEYRDQLSFERPYVRTRGFKTVKKGSPKININKPAITGKVASPTNIEISFEADDGATIDVESLEVLYGWLSLNITDRIKEHAKLSAQGLLASNVTLPEGDHTIKIVIKDNKGRESIEEFSFSIEN